MKKIFLLIFLLASFLYDFAAHISGGEMYYRYVGPGAAANTLKYEVTLRLFRDCSASGTFVAPMPSEVIISIFNNADDSRVADITLPRDSAIDKRLSKVDFSCIQFAPEVCYDVGTYHFQVDLQKNPTGYTCAFQTCCRVGGINNVVYDFNSQNGAPGVTFSCRISGTNQLGPSGINSSPVFRLKDTALVCASNFFNLDFGADDPDGDSLSYSFCNAYGCATDVVNATPVPSGFPVNTIFPSLTYRGVYTGNTPLGTGITIDPVTGIISGNAPAISGRYVINVCITEWRNGIAIGSHRKDFILKIADCNKTTANLNPQYFTCDGFTLNFTNNATNVSGTLYEWNFGDPASGNNNTSTSSTPTHTFTDTGVYTLKLKVSVGGRCEDSTTAKVKVYPGFFPDFAPRAPFCKGVPVLFDDKTTTKYGVTTGWRWDFGNTTVIDDTSNQKNPSYAYNAAGSYTVTLIVGNTFGCIDTIQKSIAIPDKPPVAAFPKDTSYCALDTIQLRATGTGNFSWTPAINIIGANTATPLVYPLSPVKYYVTVNANGCTNTDSVSINPVNDLTNSIAASSVSICEGDTITLTGSSNHTDVSWQWSPVAATASPVANSTKAFPVSNTKFILTTRWGKNCIATATKDIAVKALLIPEAGPDQAICIGQQTAQLNATGADGYQWTPTTGLNNPNIANPVASPLVTTTYKVTGSTTGCTAKKFDSLKVTVRALPPLGLTNDTLICSIDTLQLKATGTGSFAWSPSYMISSVTNPTPLVSPDVPTKYYVTLTDGFGCVSNDSVMVDVKLFVTIDAGNDTTICRTDGFKLTTSSDALSYKWEPSTYLDNDKIKQPFATPLDPVITYKVTGNIGKCQSTDFVTITTVPYPVADAGNDTLVCFQQPVPLHATGGSTYSWSPSIFLSTTNSADPLVVNPTVDTRYTVTVTDNKGCPKPVTDSVLVKVYPKVNARVNNDTSVVIGQPLLLNATGGQSNDTYLWSPSTGLDNPFIQNPIATPESDIEYTMQLTTLIGNCIGRDSVKVKVFILPPSFYVPTAFSPNGDGLNEILKPIALGIRKLSYFKIYNRAGVLIFSTTQIGVGWDGTYKGNPQDPANYVWMAQGVTYKGEVITRKGNAVLVR